MLLTLPNFEKVYFRSSRVVSELRLPTRIEKVSSRMSSADIFGIFLRKFGIFLKNIENLSSILKPPKN